MRRIPALLIVIAATAVVGSACSFVTPTAYLAASRAPTPLADGLALPASAGGGSASSAAKATPVPITSGPLDLTASSTVTVDLSGSWLAWTPLRYRAAGDRWVSVPGTSEWACPTGTYVFFGSYDLGFATFLADLLANLDAPLQSLARQGSAWIKPFTYGPQCAKAFDGKTITVNTPALGSATRVTYMYITTTSSALQPVLFTGADGVTTEFPAGGLPIQATSWVKVNLKAAAPATPTTPTAKIVARATPTWVAGGAFTDARTLWYEVDARTSSDPAGGALSYAWDLDGDGTYGDASASPDPAGTLPNGVAIVPLSVLDAASSRGELTVGVRVTTTAGTSATATTKLTVVPNQVYDPVNRSSFTFANATPAVGAEVELNLQYAGGYYRPYACIDADDDGTFEGSVQVAMNGTATYAAGAARPAGVHMVSVAFTNTSSSSICTGLAVGAPNIMVFRLPYTSSAARRGGSAATLRADDYTAPTRITLTGGRTIRESAKAPRTMRLDGAVFGGNYRWSAPRSGNGVARPRGLAAFARGAYVARAGRMTLVGGAASQVGIGDGTMLLQGSDRSDLLCVAVTSVGPEQRTLILGGAGAGARLQGSLSGAGFSMPFDALGLVDVTGSGKKLQPVFGQVRPFANTATLTAVTGASRALPKACRALVRHLPAPDDGGSSRPSNVTG